MPTSPSPIPISQADLEALTGKYTEILRLRRPNALGTDDDDPSASEAEDDEDEEDPREAMAKLATEFPGVLRELDDFPLELIEVRLSALADARRDLAKLEPWMVACITFHRLARGALSAKRWLGGRKEIDDAVREAFIAAVPRLPFSRDAQRWETDLLALAHPPRGRISHLVFERVGDAMGLSAKEARILVFGPSRRERRAARLI